MAAHFAGDLEVKPVSFFAFALYKFGFDLLFWGSRDGYFSLSTQKD
jgi:hypothetical protein